MTPGEVRGALLILAVMVFAMLMGVWLGLSVPMAAPASQSLAAQPAPSPQRNAAAQQLSCNSRAVCCITTLLSILITFVVRTALHCRAPARPDCSVGDRYRVWLRAGDIPTHLLGIGIYRL